VAVDAVHDAHPAGRPAVPAHGHRGSRPDGRRHPRELGGLLGAIYIVQNFDAVFTLTAGGLGTANLPYAIYQTFYFANEYGLASAAGVVVVIGTIIVATFALRTVFSLFKKEAAR
jgi:sorbitol/mannitol transport system permease protein